MSSDDSTTLKLIEILPQAEPRNYWNTVGKDQEFFPTKPRPESIPTLNKNGKVTTEPVDEWWINSPEHHFCFWEYVRKNSQHDGNMEPLLQSEIAELFGYSSTKMHFMIKEAMDRLTTPENMKVLQDLFELLLEDPTEDLTPYEAAATISESEENQE